MVLFQSIKKTQENEIIQDLISKVQPLIQLRFQSQSLNTRLFRWEMVKSHFKIPETQSKRQMCTPHMHLTSRLLMSMM